MNPSWNPQANSSNLVIRVSGNTVYVGGAFTRIGSAVLTRNRLAALDAVTGEPTAWNPNATTQLVTSLELVGDLAYVGGSFTTVGGAPRNRLAALSLATGLATAWNPSVTGTGAIVRDLKVVGDIVYVGGNFTTAGGAPRSHIAAFNTSDNAALPWSPTAGSQVFALGVAGDLVYAAGAFTSIGGLNRNRLAALGADGLATPWDPNANGEVLDLVVAGDTIYAAGSFTIIGGENRRGIAAVDTTSGAVTAWSPQMSTLTAGSLPVARKLALADDSLLVGGTFASIGGVARQRLAALNVATGEATDWNPGANAEVRALAHAAGMVYVGGLFTEVGGETRSRLAAVDAVTGALRDWSPNLTGRTGAGVFALLSDGAGSLYVGGAFTNAAATTRNSLAAFSPLSGALLSWNPNPAAATATTSPRINALTLSGNTLYAGGEFTANGGLARARLAALDTASAAAVGNFNPGASNEVFALAVAGDILYAGGAFTNAGGQVRGRLAAIETATGQATVWNPNATPVQTATRVSALVVANQSVYAGGVYTGIGGAFRNRAAGLRIANGQAHDWDPNANAPVRALFRTADAIYMGGEFTTLGGIRNPYFAVFDARPRFLPDTAQVLPNGNFRVQVASGDGERLIIRGTEDFTSGSDVLIHTDLNGAPFVFEDDEVRPRRFYEMILETE